MAAINNLSELVLNSLNKLFNKLSITGYESYCAIDNLLIYSFIEDLLDAYNTCITEEDYYYIRKALDCLYGSCLIPYPQYINQEKIPSNIFYISC